MNGYFLMARGTLKHSRFKPTGPWSQFEAWCWLIESAAYAPYDVVTMNGRNKRIIHLEPGQLTFSIRFLAKAWRWSDKRVQRFLSALVSDQSVTTQTTTGQTIITLCNWAKYQRPETGATTQSATTVTTQPTTKMTKINKTKNNVPSNDGFDNWYAIYPNKKNPADARKAYAKAIRSVAPNLLLAQTKAFAEMWSQQPPDRRKYIPYPATWLNKGGYANDADSESRVIDPVLNARAFTDEQWRKRLVYSEDAERWLPAWGPRPGMPGCIAPSHLILFSVGSQPVPHDISQQKRIHS